MQVVEVWVEQVELVQVDQVQVEQEVQLEQMPVQPTPSSSDSSLIFFMATISLVLLFLPWRSGHRIQGEGKNFED